MSNSEPKVALPIRVPAHYIERLDVLAKQLDLDRSEVARRALRNGMEGLEAITKYVGNPLAETFLNMVTAMLESDPEERAEVRRVLRSIGEEKKSKKRKPGLEPA